MWTRRLSATLDSTVAFPRAAQVSTNTPGGRSAGSSLIRHVIPPDYVPHVRVHCDERNFHLVWSTHTYFIPSQPCFSHPACVIYLAEKQKINQDILTVCSKMNTSSQQHETQLPDSRRDKKERRAGIILRDGGRTRSGALSLRAQWSLFLHHTHRFGGENVWMHNSETVVAARIPLNNLQFGTWNMQPRGDQSLCMKRRHICKTFVHFQQLCMRLPSILTYSWSHKQRPSLTGSLGHLKSGHFSSGSHEKSAEGMHKAPVTTAVAKQLLKTS